MSTEQSALQRWVQRAKWVGAWLAVAVLGFLIGLYVVAPRIQQSSPGYLPRNYLDMPTGVVRFRTTEGITSLPVRVARSFDAEQQGLRYVGSEALESAYLLYDQGEVVNYDEYYDMQGIRAPLSLGVIDGQGKVVTIKDVTPGRDSVTVQTDHQWVLAVKQGKLDQLGIRRGSTLVNESVKKIAP